MDWIDMAQGAVVNTAMNIQFYEKWAIYCLAGLQSASQEGLCSMKLVFN